MVRLFDGMKGVYIVAYGGLLPPRPCSNPIEGLAEATG